MEIGLYLILSFILINCIKILKGNGNIKITLFLLVILIIINFIILKF